MFEELNKRRQAVELNIAKSFGYSPQEEIVEKAEDNDIEKGKWNVGDTFTRHGITYKCTGFSSATGRPTWSRVKDGAAKQDTEDSVKKINKVNQHEFEKKMSDDEKKRVMRLAEKVSADSKDAPRHLEEEAMSYDELVRFEQAMRIFSGSSDLNKTTRENCKKWAELARSEMNSREEQEKKKGEDTKKEEAANKLKQFLQKLSPSYTDISKVTAFKMKNGDVAVLYDGNSVATLSSVAGKLLEDAGVKFEEDEAKQKKMITDQLKEDGEGKKEEEKEISHKEIVNFFEKNADKFLEFKSGDLEGTDLEKEFKKYSKYAKLGKSFDSSEEEDWEVYKTNKELSGYDVIDVGEGTDAFVALLIKKQQEKVDKKK